jgi:hypothetical protein
MNPKNGKLEGRKGIATITTTDKANLAKAREAHILAKLSGLTQEDIYMLGCDHVLRAAKSP